MAAEIGNRPSVGTFLPAVTVPDDSDFDGYPSDSLYPSDDLYPEG